MGRQRVERPEGGIALHFECSRRHAELKICEIVFVVVGSLSLCAAQDAVSAVEGTVKKVDASTKTIVVETSDGADHSFQYVGWTVVDGSDQSLARQHSRPILRLDHGREVVAH